MKKEDLEKLIDELKTNHDNDKENFQKQIDELKNNLATNVAAINNNLNDLKKVNKSINERINDLNTPQVKSDRLTRLLSIVSCLFSAAALLFALFSLIVH